MSNFEHICQKRNIYIQALPNKRVDESNEKMMRAEKAKRALEILEEMQYGSNPCAEGDD